MAAHTVFQVCLRFSKTRVAGSGWVPLLVSRAAGVHWPGMSWYSGVLPAGSDVKAVAPGSTGPDTFRGILDISTQELVLRATGGLMTMLTAPGAGTNTNTGSAHQDAFNDLAEREAEEIAAVLNAGLFAPVLDQWHPGQPHLAEFVIRRPDSYNAVGAVANITALAAVGYRSPAEQVAELTGLGGGLNDARIGRDTRSAQTALEDAVRAGTGKYPQEPLPPHCKPIAKRCKRAK